MSIDPSSLGLVPDDGSPRIPAATPKQSGEYVWPDGSVSPDRASYERRAEQLRREHNEQVMEAHRAAQAQRNRLGYENRKMREAQQAALDHNRQTFLTTPGEQAMAERAAAQREYRERYGIN